MEFLINYRINPESERKELLAKLINQFVEEVYQEDCEEFDTLKGDFMGAYVLTVEEEEEYEQTDFIGDILNFIEQSLLDEELKEGELTLALSIYVEEFNS